MTNIISTMFEYQISKTILYSYKNAMDLKSFLVPSVFSVAVSPLAGGGGTAAMLVSEVSGDVTAVSSTIRNKAAGAAA